LAVAAEVSRKSARSWPPIVRAVSWLGFLPVTEASPHAKLVHGVGPSCVRDTGLGCMKKFEVKILLWLYLAVIIGLIALWLVTKGIGKTSHF